VEVSVTVDEGIVMLVACTDTAVEVAVGAADNIWLGVGVTGRSGVAVG
jgi:hypothetical protein